MKKLFKTLVVGVNLHLFDNPNLSDPITYDSLPDEAVTDIGDNIEKFIETAEYWDKFCHHSTVKKGHKKFSYRRLIRPDVRPEDIHEMAELVAPRPTKIALATFEKSVGNYGENGEYTREDLMFHLDNTVLSLTSTLKEKMRQILDLVKGKAFVSSRATITYETSLLNTLENAAIIFRKNEVLPWANNYYLAHLTPEEWKQLKAEVRANKESLDEKTKVAINGKEEEFAVYGDWMFSISTSKVLYKNATTQILVLQGRRGIDNESGVECSKMEGYGKTEFGDNGLGDGLIYDEDGRLTNDKNKQKGSCYINALGVGVGISDDLAILNCEVTINEVSGTTIDLAERHGYKSTSPASTLTVKVVDGDGEDIASPTITFKKKTSSGTDVSAKSGTTYPVVAGDQYYIAAAKTNYTSASVVIKHAVPGDNTLVITLVAASE